MPALRLGIPRAVLRYAQGNGVDLMLNGQGKMGGVISRAFEPKLMKPWHMWATVAVGAAVQVGYFLVIVSIRGELRFSLGVCTGLTIAMNAVVCLAVLRFQHFTIALTSRPRFASRLVGMMLMSGWAWPPLALMFWLARDITFMLGIPILVTVALLLVAMSIVAAGYFCRVGDEQMCAACGYECRTSSERCSECGSYWRRPKGLIRGHRVAHRSAIVVGVIVVLIGFLGLGPTRFGFGRLFLQLMPENVRVRMVTTGHQSLRSGPLADLLAGSISPENELLLASRLLDQRLVEEWGLARIGNTWLERKVIAGGLTAELRERFFAELLDMWLVGPDCVSAGEEFCPRMESESRDPTVGSLLNVQVYQAGVSMDGGATFEARGAIFQRFSTSNASHHRSHCFRGENLPPHLRGVSIDAPGDYDVVVRVWLAVVPVAAVPPSVEWNDDGTPVLPPGALWTKEVLLRRTITVLPVETTSDSFSESEPEE
jgi:hypothetical protein